MISNVFEILELGEWFQFEEMISYMKISTTFFFLLIAFLSRQKKDTKIIKNTRMFPVIVKIKDPIPVELSHLIFF